MKTLKRLLLFAVLLVFAVPALAAKGPPDAEIPDTGELYGDLYVILRNADGVPILSSDGCIQPISAATDSTEIVTSDGTITFAVTEGEPFGLPTYTDTAGDLVECELTEAMADWVIGVDFGRLNLGRSPESVLEHAFDEAVTKMNLAGETGGAIEVDPAGRLVVTYYDAVEAEMVVKTIDAPAENLALYIKMLRDGHWITGIDSTSPQKGGPPDGKGPSAGDGPSTEPRPVLSSAAIALLPTEYQGLGVAENTTADLSNDQLQLAAALLAAAADKTGSITLDKVVYINSIYGINQLGSVPGEVEGKTYFDFSAFSYDRSLYAGRSSGSCNTGWIWVLQPVAGTVYFEPTCMEILGYDPGAAEPVNSVHFENMDEIYTTEGLVDYVTFDMNVRGFTQAADDALQVLEYLHNYKVPEDLYGE